MATITITNLTSPAVEVPIPDLYAVVPATGLKTLVTDRTLSDLSRMPGLQAAVAAGTVAVSIVYTAAELASGLADAPAEDLGSIPTFRLLFANQPTHNDTVTVGADIYQFKLVATDIIVTNDAYIGVVISVVNAAATKTSLIAAMNGTALATGLTKAAGAAAARVGTVPLKATSVGTTVVCQPANAVGGTPIVGSPSILLAESITDAADIWDVGNVNVNTLGGRTGAVRSRATREITLTAAMVTSGVRIDFPFTPTGFRISARASTGGLRAGAVTDLAVIATTGILLSGLGQAAPAYQATDVLTVEAWS